MKSRYVIMKLDRILHSVLAESVQGGADTAEAAHSAGRASEALSQRHNAAICAWHRTADAGGLDQGGI